MVHEATTRHEGVEGLPPCVEGMLLENEQSDEK